MNEIVYTARVYFKPVYIKMSDCNTDEEAVQAANKLAEGLAALLRSICGDIFVDAVGVERITLSECLKEVEHIGDQGMDWSDTECQ